MWKEIMLVNGTIEGANGMAMNKKELFNLLSENGYEFTGSWEVIEKEELTKAVEKIVDSISYNDFLDMLAEYGNIYGDTEAEGVKYFFGSNSGTGSFNQVIERGLNDEMKSLYKKYTETNWQVSDTFGADLGWAIVEKFKEQLK